jgi:hypothetical protein
MGLIVHSRFNNLSDLKEIFMKTNRKIMIYLSILALLDMIIPIPFTALMLIYIILEKPAWFRNLVTDIYNS